MDLLWVVGILFPRPLAQMSVPFLLVVPILRFMLLVWTESYFAMGRDVPGIGPSRNVLLMEQCCHGLRVESGAKEFRILGGDRFTCSSTPFLFGSVYIYLIVL